MVDFGAAADSSGASTARAARSRSAARISARVVGFTAAGMAAVAGSGVVLDVPLTAAESAGALSRNPLGWARRRPVGLVRSPSVWARRG
ncbi:hypothetical protein StoSoilB22_38830 [Arthrobacter sp. StoSoilB22]|nr:hypothetical protein StoSoilB22_38830 [Arthrobacter sp. StoSoilB22]